MNTSNQYFVSKDMMALIFTIGSVFTKTLFSQQVSDGIDLHHQISISKVSNGIDLHRKDFHCSWDSFGLTTATGAVEYLLD